MSSLVDLLIPERKYVVLTLDSFLSTKSNNILRGIGQQGEDRGRKREKARQITNPPGEAFMKHGGRTAWHSWRIHSADERDTCMLPEKKEARKECQPRFELDVLSASNGRKGSRTVFEESNTHSLRLAI